MNTRSAMWPLVIAFAAAFVPQYLAPHLVTAYLSVHLSESDAGLLVMSETATLALATMFGFVLPAHWLRRLCLWGPLTAAAGEWVSIGLASMDSLMPVRAVVGLGCGIGGFAATQLIGSSESPGRGFGLANGVLSITAAVGLSLVPLLPGNAGARVFAPLTLVCAGLALILYFALRGASRLDSALPSADLASHDSWFTGPVFAMLLMTALVFIPFGGFFVFSVQQGLKIGMSDVQIGAALGWTTAAGLLGGVFAAWTSGRWGLVRPILLACALAVVTCVAVGTAANAVAFTAAFALYSATFMFAMAYVLAVCAAADPSGRASALLAGAMFMAFAIGSALAGYLLEMRLPQLIWIGGAIACAAAAIPGTVGARRAEAISHAPSAPVVTSPKMESITP